MKTFRTVKKKMNNWNFLSNQTPLLNPIFLRCCITSTLSTSAHIIYLFHEANTDEEYMNSIYMATAAISVFTSYINTSYNVSTFKTFFAKTDKTLHQSKLINKNYGSFQ